MKKKIQRKKTAANVAEGASQVTIFFLGAFATLLMGTADWSEDHPYKKTMLISEITGAGATIFFTTLLKILSSFLNHSADKDRFEVVDGDNNNGLELKEETNLVSSELSITPEEAREYLFSTAIRSLTYPLCFVEGSFLAMLADVIRLNLEDPSERIKEGAYDMSVAEAVLFWGVLGTGIILTPVAYIVLLNLAKKSYHVSNPEKVEQWMYQDKKGLKDLFSMWKKGQTVRFNSDRFEEIHEEEEPSSAKKEKKEIPLTGYALQNKLATDLNGPTANI